MKRYTALTRKLVALAILNLGLIVSSGAAASTLDDIKFAALPGDKFEIQMMFSESVAEPKVYSIDNPARIVLDFEGAQSTLTEKKYALPFENAQSVVVLTAGDRTRVIVNLKQAAPYAVQMAGNVASLNVGGGGAGAVASVGHTSIEQSALGASRSATGGGVTDIDFKRGEKGEGMLTVTLANPKTEVDIAQQGKNIVLKFFRTSLPEYLNRRLDVLDFATPVSVVDSVASDGTTIITIAASGEYDYQAYQADEQYVVSVKPLTRAEQEERQNKFAFVGKKLSLNFQDIEVRSVLQLIADFTDLNLVASDTVTGNITLRLENVPWDQALAIVLKAKGLDKRQEGNVLMVAPAVEIAERERLQVEANKQLIELAPLVTEFVRIRYADAGKLFELFDVKKGGNSGGANKGATSSILSERGTAIVDQRTNTIILTDVEEKIAEFRRLVREIDIPIRQVEIEARIIIASTEFRKEIGVRWGAQGLRNPGNGQLGFGGSLENFSSPNNPIEIFGGTGGTILVNDDALAVDLGVANPSGRFALELLTNNTFIDLELSAAQNDGVLEVVSQPKVLTGDKQKAVIRAGTEIAYRSQTSSGATDVEFKEAVLKLEVTPQITPDNRVIMDLLVSKDSVQEVEGGGEPRINITDVTTQALVGDGQTLVLGGIFEMEEENFVNKVPLLGDIPLVGRLFRNNIDRRDKREILIFITPRIINDALLDR